MRKCHRKIVNTFQETMTLHYSIFPHFDIRVFICLAKIKRRIKRNSWHNNKVVFTEVQVKETTVSMKTVSVQSKIMQIFPYHRNS